VNTPTTVFSNYSTVNMLVQAGRPRPLQHLCCTYTTSYNKHDTVLIQGLRFSWW